MPGVALRGAVPGVALRGAVRCNGMNDAATASDRQARMRVVQEGVDAMAPPVGDAAEHPTGWDSAASQSIRYKRRILGMLGKRVDDARLSEVTDGRDLRGRRWKLKTLLSSALLGLVSGSRSLKEVEWLTDELPAEVRRRLGIPRRVPDTTLRDALLRLSPDDLRRSLHAVTHAATRRKALSPDGLPFGVIALEGKGTAVPAADDFFAQRQTAAEDCSAAAPTGDRSLPARSPPPPPLRSPRRGAPWRPTAPCPGLCPPTQPLSLFLALAPVNTTRAPENRSGVAGG